MKLLLLIMKFGVAVIGIEILILATLIVILFRKFKKGEEREDELSQHNT